VPSLRAPPSLRARVCRLSVRFQGGPPGRTRRRHGGLVRHSAGAPCRTGPTPVGWREEQEAGPLNRQQVSAMRARGVPAPAAGIVRGRSEPVKAVCDRRATAPVELPGERTHEDDLDRTCPDQEMAAIGSRDTSGQDGMTLTVILQRHLSHACGWPSDTPSTAG
jgi:hypothetical protein